MSENSKFYKDIIESIQKITTLDKHYSSNVKNRPNKSPEMDKCRSNLYDQINQFGSGFKPPKK